MAFFSVVDNIVETFLQTVSEKYNIDKNELRILFQNGCIKNNNNAEVKYSGELTKLSKNELITHCKARGLKTTGTKNDLIDRLTGGTNSVENTSNDKEKVKGKAKVKENAKPKEQVAPTIIKNVQSTIQTIQISKNSFGNFEHSDTKFVFDRHSQEVIGKQKEDGSVSPLTDEDIDECNKYKFKYVIPKNLNTNKTKVIIDELGEDEIDENQIGEILEEEEEYVEEGEEEEYVEEEEEFDED
jgi:hypothetical protein